MFHKDLTDLMYILRKDRITRQFAIGVLLICLISSVIFSYTLAILLFSSYILGLLVCYIFIKFKKQTSSCLHRLVDFYKDYSPIPKKIAHSCSICDDLSCRRHKQDCNTVPWDDLIIDEKLNSAVENFYGRILEDFVLSWYKSLSDDESFINELQYGLRFSTASVIKRILEIDLATLISKKLLPCAIKHIDDYMYIEQIAKLKNGRLNDVAIEYLGKRLHGAVTTRNNELIYLREVTSSVLPFILPKKYFHCRNYAVLFQEIVAGWVLLPLMDVLSNPNIINSLIIIGANYKTKHVKRKELTTKVKFLHNFGYAKKDKKSLFYRDLNEIKENTELLYTFMQFLKSEDQVHLLQFCLDVDEFNNKLMAPDLSKKILEELYGEAITLHNEYISKNSINFVKCSEDISDNLKELLKDGILSIAKIKVSGPLIQAYKEVFDNLEENWLPIFFQSNEFYSCLCGSKVTAQYNKATANKVRRNESQTSTSKLSSLGKIRSALKNTTPIEGSICPPEIQSIEDGGDIAVPVCYSLFRDISKWEISISSYVSLNKVIYFHVNVKRPNTVSNEMETHRVVLRKDQDFYTLKAKLIEFHGENEICDSPLPARKAGSDIGTRMTGYERFLKKLLQNSTLRGSDLLHTFLTIEEDFSMYISTCGAPVQDLGNIYQTVAQKLRKEKGQHLDNFMNVFMASTGNDKTGKFIAPEVGDEVDNWNAGPQHIPPPKTYRNYVFNDNFGITCSKKRIFNVPNVMMKLYVAICSIVSETVESIWHIIIRRELSYGLSQQNLQYLVTFLHEVIFDDPSDLPTKLELEARKREALEILNRIPNKWPNKLLGQNFFKGLHRLWEISQHPHYNKQLTYQLLDIVIMELYPNILKNK
ncbi:hypothetical protein HHI36_020197 [Cryptolaemus montrouzieri]|uniref:Sorting nexin-14-like n=1 Tax=Cryptolaemus montrouzieri TaxID=559131 RepID=A0ABD2N9J1_9CUCU